MTPERRASESAALRNALAELNRILEARTDALVQAEAELRGARRRITNLTNELDARRRELHVALTSTSWRITEPIRRAGARGRRVARWGRRLLGRLAGAAPADRVPPAEIPEVHEPQRALRVASTLRYDRSRIDPGRDTVLLICPHAGRTRATIVAENVARRLALTHNVVAVFLGPGELIPHFAASCAALVGPLLGPDLAAVDAECLVEQLCASYAFRFALVNGLESHAVLRPLSRRLMPVVTLVHEFAASSPPAPWRPRPEAPGPALDLATAVVFSAEMVARAARRDHPTLMGHRTHVLRPGRCDEPPRWGEGEPGVPDEEDLRRRLRPADGALVVLGGGALEFRSGVDLFVSCAAAVAARCPDRPVQFVWSPRGEHDRAYWSYLADHIADSGLAQAVTVVDAAADARTVSALADVFFLAARLDPTPAAALEAALAGIPVVGFEGATGLAELLGEDAVGRRCVVPRFDTAVAARLIAEFARDDGARAEAGAAARRAAARALDMDRYTDRLAAVARDAVAVIRRRAQDLETIREDPLFDTHVYLPPDHPPATRGEAIVDFLTRWDAVGLSRQGALNGAFRRPCVGFHPQVYAHDNLARCAADAPNPLADFIRRGKPDGPWCSELITPPPSPPSPRDGLRVALHAHFHYPELVDEFMRRLALNSWPCDLWLSTDTEAKARALGAATASWGRGQVQIRVLPNRGRDLAPLLTAFAEAFARDYDVVGHLHGKRSLLIADATVGEAWREFLWQHLVGGLHPMMDVIVGRFADQADLGLVFAADPHLPDWTENLAIARGLAERMGIAEPLPPFCDFPVGTMFWARPQALRPLFELELDWADYPDEPAPIDGTLLHALERLLPFAARHAGYRCATTHVPGVTW